MRLKQARASARTLAMGLAVAALMATAACHRKTVDRNAPDEPTSFLTNFTPLKLVDQDGRPFVVNDLRGKVVLFNFIFTSCPNVCPIQTQALAEVQRAMSAGDRDLVQFVSVSIDPVHDAPPVLLSFAKQFKVDFGHWTFVTGGTEDIDRLSDRLRLFAQNKDRRPENHGTTMWLMDAKGRLMQRYAGNPPEVPRLVSELHNLVQLTN